MNLKYKYGILALSLAAMSLQSCKKEFLDTKPSDAVTGNVIFNSTETAYMALNGIHAFMNNLSAYGINNVHRDFGVKHTDLQSDLMGNDLVSHDAGGYDWFYGYYNYNAPRDVSNEAYTMWLFYYRVINNANAIINGIDAATGPDAEKKDIKGQALAYRAWAYNRLVTRFSKQYFTDASLTANNGSAPGVPVYLNSASGESKGNPRGTINDVVNQMTSDINEALTLLSESGIVRPNKSHINTNVAHGIAARIAMYKGDWASALDNANKAKEGFSFMATADFTSGMNQAANPEFMWASVLTDAQYTEMGVVNFISFFDYTYPAGYAGGTSVYRKITKELYDMVPAADKRKGWWQASGTHAYKSRKFRSRSSSGPVADMTYMRVSEMYLIAAEASARLNDLTTAQNNLRTLLNSRIASPTIPTTKDELISKVLLERRIELWGEGFGYTDLKERYLGLNRATGPNNHNEAQALVLKLEPDHNWWTFKIPKAELDTNPNINQEDQNP